MSHHSTLWHHPVPGNPTHLSRHQVGWATLNIEQSTHFDIRRRPRACQPRHPSPRPSSPLLFRWLAHKQKVLRAILAAFVCFHSPKLFKRLDIFDGESGCEQKRCSRKELGSRGEEKISRDSGSHAWRAFNQGFNATTNFFQRAKNCWVFFFFFFTSPAQSLKRKIFSV